MARPSIHQYVFLLLVNKVWSFQSFHIFFLTIKIEFYCMRLVMPGGRLWLLEVIKNILVIEDAKCKDIH
jgi:hypothetical protein